MNKIEIISLSIPELERLLDASGERLIKKMKEEESAPSEYEELTLDQAAKELHCHKATLRRKMLEKNIPGTRIGKEIVLQRKDLKKIKRPAH